MFFCGISTYGLIFVLSWTFFLQIHKVEKFMAMADIRDGIFISQKRSLKRTQKQQSWIIRRKTGLCNPKNKNSTHLCEFMDDMGKYVNGKNKGISLSKIIQYICSHCVRYTTTHRCIRRCIRKIQSWEISLNFSLVCARMQNICKGDRFTVFNLHNNLQNESPRGWRLQFLYWILKKKLIFFSSINIFLNLTIYN